MATASSSHAAEAAHFAGSPQAPGFLASAAELSPTSASTPESVDSQGSGAATAPATRAPTERGSTGSLRGRRIAILTYGSRGDVQPFVALGTRLVQEGAEVLVVTNVDHVGFVASFGLRAAGTAGSCREDHESAEFAHGIATGDFGPFFAWQFKDKAAKRPEIAEREREAIVTFTPHLIYATPLTYRQVCELSGELRVPMILGSLFPVENPLSHLGFRPFRQPVHPTLIHWTPQLTTVHAWQQHLSHVTGFLVVGGQEDDVGRQDDSVFGGAAARQRLEAFLAAGEPPVYLGWGSMVVPPETAGLAVRALRAAGLRGVVLGGWARLGEHMLRGLPDEEELMAYANEHVLFVNSAPHEWLLPRCAATVHHGGAGTVAAALRAGVPTVITPCGLDQPSNAKAVETSGCGIALPQIASVTAEALADAMSRAVRDAGMRERCRGMAARLRHEDGPGAAAAAIAEHLARHDAGPDPNAASAAAAARAAFEEFLRQLGQHAGANAQHIANQFASRFGNVASA